MSDFPNMKIKSIPSYPADILGGDGIDVTKVNGHVTVDLAHGEFATQTVQLSVGSLPIVDGVVP